MTISTDVANADILFGSAMAIARWPDEMNE
jgi:hypothetical protein